MEPAHERSMLQSTKLKSVLTSDTGMQNLEFALLALVQNFLAMLPFPSFGMEMYITMMYMCHCTLEVCDLLFDFSFTWGLQLRKFLKSQKSLWTFKQC